MVEKGASEREVDMAATCGERGRQRRQHRRADWDGWGQPTSLKPSDALNSGAAHRGVQGEAAAKRFAKISPPSSPTLNALPRESWERIRYRHLSR